MVKQPPKFAEMGQHFGLRVQVEDASSKLCSACTGIVAVGGPSSLGGTLQQSLAGGVATFRDLSLSTNGTFTLAVSSGAMSITSTPVIAMGCAAASRLVFTSVPTTTAAGEGALTLEVQDDAGNRCSDGPDIALSTQPRLYGAIASPLGGAVTFPVPPFGKGQFAMVASAPLLATVTSNPFGIDCAAQSPTDPAAVVIDGLPDRLTAGAEFSAALRIVDLCGRAVPQWVGVLDLSSSDARAVVPASVPIVAGVGTVTGLRFTTAASQQLVAQGGGLFGSTAFVVEPSEPAVALRAHLSQDHLPTGRPFTLEVSAVDDFGNPVHSFRGSVMISSSDSGVTLPPVYSFSADDHGHHIFNGSFTATGDQKVVVAMTGPGALPGASAVANVSEPCASIDGSGWTT